MALSAKILVLACALVACQNVGARMLKQVRPRNQCGLSPQFLAWLLFAQNALQGGPTGRMLMGSQIDMLRQNSAAKVSCLHSANT